MIGLKQSLIFLGACVVITIILAAISAAKRRK
jgi:hypothetical protein